MDPRPPLEPPVPAAHQRPSFSDRAVALLEVLICSDFPTQVALGSTLALFGFGPLHTGGQLTIGYVVALSLIDTVVLVGLMLGFLRIHGEDPREVFLGPRPASREALLGIPLTLAALAIALAVLIGVQQVAPWLHNVERNPLQELVESPRDAALFALVIVIAGGIREELQRAFLLRRFERWLGGGAVGILVASAAFGLGHITQGWDAALATGILGAFWGIVYLRRRSVVAPVVSHSGFNLLQLTQFFVVR
jgi:membrane protease YdiL (CAAX protease family)